MFICLFVSNKGHPIGFLLKIDNPASLGKKILCNDFFLFVWFLIPMSSFDFQTQTIRCQKISKIFGKCIDLDNFFHFSPVYVFFF